MDTIGFTCLHMKLHIYAFFLLFSLFIIISCYTINVSDWKLPTNEWIAIGMAINKRCDINVFHSRHWGGGKKLLEFTFVDGNEQKKLIAEWFSLAEISHHFQGTILWVALLYRQISHIKCICLTNFPSKSAQENHNHCLLVEAFFCINCDKVAFTVTTLTVWGVKLQLNCM